MTSVGYYILETKPNGQQKDDEEERKYNMKFCEIVKRIRLKDEIIVKNGFWMRLNENRSVSRLNLMS